MNLPPPHDKSHGCFVYHGLLAVFVSCFYGRSLFFGTLSWDDPELFLHPKLLEQIHSRGFGAVFSLYGAPYLPLRDLSYVLDHLLFNANTVAAHFHNLALLAILVFLTSALLYHLFQGSKWWSIAVLIFFLHPTKVESVVWLSGRKELLAAIPIVTAFLTMAKLPVDKQDGLKSAALTLLTLIGCAAKMFSVALPCWTFCLLLLQRKPFRRSALIVTPSIVVSLLMILIHLASLKSIAHVRPSHPGFSFVDTLQIPGFIGSHYLLPFGLSHIYFFDPITWKTLLPSIPVILGYCLLFRFTPAPPPSRVWVHALLLAIPVFYLPYAQFIPTGTLYADRYSFLPLLSIAVLITMALRTLSQRSRLAALCIGFLLTALWIPANWAFQYAWKNDTSLWRQTARCYPDVPLATVNYANALIADKEFEQAEELLTLVTRQHPSYAKGFNSLGVLHLRTGQLDQAASTFELLTREFPNYGPGFCNYALVWLAQNQKDKGFRFAKRCQVLDPLSSVPARFGIHH